MQFVTWNALQDIGKDLVPDSYGHQQPISAIKKLRSVTNFGLKESKDIIDNVRTSHKNSGVINAALYASALRDELIRQGYVVSIDPGEGGSNQVGSEDWVLANTAPMSETEMNIASIIHRHMTAQSVMIGRMMTAIEEQNELLKDLMEALTE